MQQSVHVQYGPIHAVIYPGQEAGVMLVPPAETTFAHWAEMTEILSEYDLQPDVSEDIVPAFVGGADVVELKKIRRE
jgi:hypothetical protein